MRPHTGGVTALAGESDEDRTAREAREKEAARLERRRVVANNKAWASAEIVRREWLAELLAKKAAPKGGAVYVAAELGQALTPCAEHGARTRDVIWHCPPPLLAKGAPPR